MPTKNTQVLKSLENISGKKLTLGNLLWSIRRGEDISQVDFAMKLGVSKQYLCDLEQGRRAVSPQTAANYAKQLGYSAQQFIRLCLQDLVDKEGLAVSVEVQMA